MLRGADISSAQGHVDFVKMKSDGLDFVILKGCEGNKGFGAAPNAFNGVDPVYLANRAAAVKAGLLVSTYHFAYALPTDPAHPGRSPKEQAQHWFDTTGGHGSQDGELPPALDLEWPAPQDWPAWKTNAIDARQWCVDARSYMIDLWGCQPIVYTYPDFWSHLGGALIPAFVDSPLWIANYPKPYAWPVEGENPVVLKPWSKWTFWQFTGGGMQLPAGQPVDYDVFCGDLAALEALSIASV